MGMRSSDGDFLVLVVTIGGKKIKKIKTLKNNYGHIEYI